MKFIEAYRNKFLSVLENLLHKPNQTSTGRRLGVNFTVTCNPDVINEIYKSGDYERSYISRKIVEHDGAIDAMVSQDADRAAVKRKELKKFLNSEMYKRVLNVTLAELETRLSKSVGQDRSDVYECIRHSLQYGFMEEFLGINYTLDLRKKILETGFHNYKSQESFEKLGILAVFRLPMWVKNIFSPSLKQKNETFQKAVEVIYNEAEVKPNSWFAALKEMEAKGELNRKEVLGELRAIYISADTLAISLVWSFYRMSIEHEAQTRRLIKSDAYARHCYFECLRLHPPFPMVSYEKVSKCPFHRKSNYIISIFQTHRNPVYWESPEEFRPQRFEKGIGKIKAGSYIPFGGTERICPGMAMSLYIGPKVLKEVLTKYKITECATPTMKKIGIDVIDNNTFYAKVTKNGSSL